MSRLQPNQFERREAQRNGYQQSQGLRNTLLFSQNPGCRFLFSMGVKFGTERTLASLLHTGACPSIVNSLFLPQNWLQYLYAIKAPSMKASTREAAHVQGCILLHVYKGDLYACVGFDIVEKLAVDLLLRTSFTERCIFDVFTFP